MLPDEQALEGEAFNALLKAATSRADQQPPLPPEDAGNFAYLRDEYRSGFQAARRAIARPGVAARICVLIQPLQVILEGGAMSFEPTPALARDVSTTPQPVSLRWPLDAATEFCLRLDVDDTGRPWLEVDCLHEGQRLRPFTVEREDGQTLACTQPGSVLLLPLDRPALLLRGHAGDASGELRISVLDSTASG